jgi:2-oxoisovalerate dehydrogenase E1 component
MPSHWGHQGLNIVSQSSPTGTQFLQAVGAAEALVKYRALEDEHPSLRGRVQGDEIVYVSSGEGTTSQGEFWEALNSACNLRLPVLFLIEDNGYAISVPADVQTAGGDVAPLVRGFPNLYWAGALDGSDPVASHGVLAEAIRHCRERRGPAFVRALVTRPYSHSMSDDESKYKSQAVRDAEALRDCLPRFARFLEQEGVLDAEGRAMRRARAPSRSPGPRRSTSTRPTWTRAPSASPPSRGPCTRSGPRRCCRASISACATRCGGTRAS